MKGFLTRRLNELAVADKLRLSIVLCAGALLLPAFAAMLISAGVDAMGHNRQQGQAIARLLAKQAAVAMAFNNRIEAEDILAGVSSAANVLAVSMIRADGSIAASYRRPELSALDPWMRQLEQPGAHGLTSNYQGMILQTPVSHDGQQQGHLALLLDLTGLWSGVVRNLMFAVVLMCAILLLAWPLALVLARHLSEPINTLRRHMQATAGGDFSGRVSRDAHDELSDLFDGFNAMVTELEARDRALSLHHSHLEDLVSDRTRSLTLVNGELRTSMATMRDARRRAEQASEAKSRFLATMSHEIRSPLNGVIGMAELLKRTELDQHQTHFSNTILKSSRLLLGILNDILDFSRIEAGGMPLDLSSCDPGLLAEDSISLFAVDAEEKHLELVSDVRLPMGMQVRADATRLRQVLTNLVSNAVKFTSSGQVCLQVRQGAMDQHAADHTKVTLVFAVRDTGIGISAKAQAQVFSPFVQADSSTSRQFGGTGLGLAISRHLVELMGGALQVTSAPAEGSTFSFSLTLDLVDPGTSLDRPLPGRTVLVVSAEDAQAEAIAHQLHSWGMVSCRASDQADAERILAGCRAAQGPCDLILATPPETGTKAATAPSMARLLAASAAAGAGRLRAALILGGLSSLTPTPPSKTVGPFPAPVHLARPLLRDDLYQALCAPLSMLQPESLTLVPTTSRRCQDRRILVAEDNPVNQDVVAGLLAELGCIVELANNGAEAVAAVQRQRPDLVLMDCQMPVLDGYAATARILQLPGATDLPVVALTANAMAEDRSRCLAAGMVDFLAKPFDPGDLKAVLIRHLPATAPAPVGPATSVTTLTASTLADLRASFGLQRLATISNKLLRQLQDVLPLLDSIDEGLDADLRATLQFEAHRLKSASRMLGADDLGDAFATLESQAASADPATLRQLRGQLLPLLEQSRTALSAAYALPLAGQAQ